MYICSTLFMINVKIAYDIKCYECDMTICTKL